jgi:hypothetical protein
MFNFITNHLIHGQTEALKILKILAAALLPGGRLVLETFIPWDATKDNINGSVLSDQSRETTVETTSSPDGFKIINQSKVTVNFKEQLEISQTRYEKWADGKLIHAEEEEYAVRWYHRYEMELFLEKAGFSSVKIIDESFEQNEQAVVYLALNPSSPNVVLDFQ